MRQGVYTSARRQNTSCETFCDVRVQFAGTRDLEACPISKQDCPSRLALMHNCCTKLQHASDHSDNHQDPELLLHSLQTVMIQTVMAPMVISCHYADSTRMYGHWLPAAPLIPTLVPPRL